jgi:hypothetical protein
MPRASNHLNLALLNRLKCNNNSSKLLSRMPPQEIQRLQVLLLEEAQHKLMLELQTLVLKVQQLVGKEDKLQRE